MKTLQYILLSGLALLLFATGCRTTKTASKNRKGDGNKSGLVTEEKQKVDYFYVEAATQYVQGNVREAIGLYGQVLELDPENHAAMYNIAKLFFEMSDFESATKYAQNAVKLEKENFWYYGLLADAYERKNEYDKAIDILEEVIVKFPKDNNTYYNLAQLYVRKKKYQEAIAVYDKLETKQGLNEDISFRKHQLYMMSGQNEEARMEIERLLKVNPYNPEYYQVLYDMHMLNNEKEKAFSTLEKIIEIDPGNGFALFSLADFYKSKGDMKKSDEYLLQAFQNPGIPLEGKVQLIAGLYPFISTNAEVRGRMEKLSQILFKMYPESAQVFGIRADIFRQAGKNDSARVYYHQALEIEPANEGIWQETLFLDSEEEDFPAMKKDAENALEYFPNQPLFHYFNGFSSAQMKEYDEAIYSFEKIKKLGSPNMELLIQTYQQLADLYNDTKKYSKSDENFDLALELTPGNASLLNNYAYYLSVRDARLEDASEMVKKALELEPNNSAYQDTFGWILYQMGDFKAAEKWIAKALDNGASAEVAEHYGDVWYKLGDKDKALEYWKKAQQMGAKDLKIDDKINTSKAND